MSEDSTYIPDLVFVRLAMPERTDKSAFLLHALRNFEAVLAYAEMLEAQAAEITPDTGPSRSA